jgi:uncharacterized protein YndB with AHSA1/START domain
MTEHQEPTERSDVQTASSSIDLDQPVDEVWRSITEPDRLARWMGEGSTIEPWPSGELRLTDVATGVPKRGRVGSVVPERSIEFVWWPESDPDSSGHVSFTLTPLEPGTRITVVESTAGAPAPGRIFALAAGGAWRLALLSMASRLSITARAPSR